MEFPEYPKTPRFKMRCSVTEKIDGTNALIRISNDNDLSPVIAVVQAENGLKYNVRAGSRKRWITPENDNFGFAGWVDRNAQWLVNNLGEGDHYGEWYGCGIQRGYGLVGKRLALFDGPGRYPWAVDEDAERERDSDAPVCTRYVDLNGGSVGVVPLLYQGSLDEVLEVVRDPDAARLRFLPQGSRAQPGFERTEGVIVQLRGSGGGQRFKIVWDKGYS